MQKKENVDTCHKKSFISHVLTAAIAIFQTFYVLSVYLLYFNVL